MRLVQPLLALVLAVALLPAGAWAQVSGHVVERAELDRLLATRVDQERSDREAIHRLLQRPEVRDIAGRFGLDLTRADAAVNTLEGPELEQLAAQARTVDGALSGGSNVVISTTTLIIILLLIILLIVALR